MVASTVIRLFGWAVLVVVLALTEGLKDYKTHGFSSQMSQKGGNLLVDTDDRVQNLSYLEIYLFDITNPEEVIQKGARPALVERGPYTYREYRHKYNIIYNDNKTVSYREQHRYVFDREKSVGLESDVVTTANVVMMTVADIVRYEYTNILELVEYILELTGSKLFTKLSVREILWGYEDPLLKLINDRLRPFNISLSNNIAGLFRGKNDTDDGIYTVFTEGKKNETINRWNGLKELPYWTTKQCRMINGTVGRYFPPVVKENDILKIFSSKAYRSFNLKYIGNITMDDKQLYRFLIPDKAFANTTENRGFCTPINNCLLSGLWNVTLYRDLSPIILSQPHFYAADKRLVDNVTGLHPTAIQHQTILDIEPMTGIVRSMNKRLQYNIDTRFTGGLILPMIWINQSSSYDKLSSSVEFTVKITRPTSAYPFIITIGILVSGVLAIFAIKTTMETRA